MQDLTNDYNLKAGGNGPGFGFSLINNELGQRRKARSAASLAEIETRRW